MKSAVSLKASRSYTFSLRRLYPCPPGNSRVTVSVYSRRVTISMQRERSGVSSILSTKYLQPLHHNAYSNILRSDKRPFTRPTGISGASAVSLPHPLVKDGLATFGYGSPGYNFHLIRPDAAQILEILHQATGQLLLIDSVIFKFDVYSYHISVVM